MGRRWREVIKEAVVTSWWQGDTGLGRHEIGLGVRTLHLLAYVYKQVA